MSTRSSGRFERVLGPRLNLKELNVICWCLFFFFLAPAIFRAVQMQNQHGKPIQYADFVNFYAMGRILNEYPAADLYDLALQNRICNEIAPPRSGSYGPIPYPPFVGIPFKFLAKLPYSTAYTAWLLISLSLYLSALVMIGFRFYRREPLRFSLIVCIALCYFPFTIETLVNGQLSAVGFFFLALAFLLDDSGRLFESGLALSMCAYKPPLLVLVIPMLFATRRFKNLAGVVTGGAVLALFATMVLGREVWSGYLGMIFHFGQISIGVKNGSNLNVTQYVDFVNFSSLVPNGRSWPVLVVLFGCGFLASLSLVRAWWRAANAGKAAMRLGWAAAITWTLLLNTYVPIYDTTLVVLSILISDGALQDAAQEHSRQLLNLFWPVIFVSSWFTIDVARIWHVQIITILLAALGVFQFRALNSAEAPVAIDAAS